MLSVMHCIVYNTYQLFSLLWLFFHYYDWFLLLWLLAYVRYYTSSTNFMCCLHMVTLSQSKFIVLNLYRLSLCDQVTKFNKLWKVFLIKINKKRYENTITLWWKTFIHQSLAAKRIMKIIFSVLWIFNLRLQVHGCLQHKHVMVIIGRKVGRRWMASNHQNHLWKHISTQEMSSKT